MTNEQVHKTNGKETRKLVMKDDIMFKVCIYWYGEGWFTRNGRERE